jgi:glycosidase
MTGADDPDNRRMMRFGDQLTTLERAMLARTRAIAAMRNAHSALRSGDFLTLKANKTTYAYLRADFTERLLVVLNKADADEIVDIELPKGIPVGALIDAATGESFPVNGRHVNIPVEGTGWRVFSVSR